MYRKKHNPVHEVFKGDMFMNLTLWPCKCKTLTQITEFMMLQWKGNTINQRKTKDHVVHTCKLAINQESFTGPTKIICIEKLTWNVHIHQFPCRFYLPSSKWGHSGEYPEWLDQCRFSELINTPGNGGTTHDPCSICLQDFIMGFSTSLDYREDQRPMICALYLCLRPASFNYSPLDFNLPLPHPLANGDPGLYIYQQS